MSYQGDYAAASTVVFNFNTAAFADGSPVTLAGTPAVSVYKNSTTESTTGVTLTVDYDARTGMHHVVIDTSADGTFYAAGNDFDVVITAGTVGGTSVVGRVVGSFSLANRSGIVKAMNANVVTASAVATDAVNEIADGILDRDMSVGTDSGSTTVRTVRQALRFLRNKWGIVANALTVCKEDDTTTSWTAVVTPDNTAVPITGSDPAG